MVRSNNVAKTIQSLTREQLVHIGEVSYNLSLVVSSGLPALRAAIIAEMVKIADCPACGDSECYPDNHLFQPDEYNTSATGESSFTESLAAFMQTHCSDLSLGDLPEDFVSGGPTSGPSASEETPAQVIARVLTAAKQAAQQQQQQQQRQPDPAQDQQREEQSVPGGTGATPQSNDSTNSVLMKLLENQQQQMQVQQRQQQQLLDVLANGSGGLDRIPIPNGPTFQGAQPNQNPDMAPPSGKIVIQPVANKNKAQFTNIALNPLLAVEGDTSEIDFSKLKRKMTSGISAGRTPTVLRETYWPHQTLSTVLFPYPPSYWNLSVTQFYSGWINKLLYEMDPALNGSAMHNKLKFLSLVSKVIHSSSLESALTVNASFLQAYEQRQLEWNGEWNELQTFHDSLVDQLMFKRLQEKNKPQDPNNPPKKQRLEERHEKPQADERVIEFRIRFQENKCSHPSDHKTLGGAVTLRHICGGCLKVKNESVSDHAAYNCSNKPFFQ